MSIVIKVINSGDKNLKKAFVKFPINTLYKDCPFYVPPLIQDELESLDTKKNPAFDFCEMQLFLVYKNDNIVGRIAAIINHRANEIWNKKQGRFSFVDFIDDNDVVEALFSAAEKWLKEKGMDTIIGPIGFTDLDPEGLLIDGYDKISTMATRYSYPYYRTQIERLGFEKDADWNEFYIPIPAHTPERHQRIATMIGERYGLKHLSFHNFKQVTPYVSKLFKCLNEAYEPLYGFSALTQHQIDYYVKKYVPLLRWDVVQIVIKEDTDEVVGFGVGIPSLSAALIKSRGKLFPFGWIQLIQALKSKNNKTVDLMIMGVLPEYQGKGVNAMIFNGFIPSAYKSGFRFAESNPELEMNNKMQSLWDGFDATNHKRRRAYVRYLK